MDPLLLAYLSLTAALVITPGATTAVVVARLPVILLGIQLAGGLYLAWLGFGSTRRLMQHDALPISGTILAARGTIGHHAAREGLTVNLLNPSIALFYISVVPSFLPTPTPRGYYVQLAAVHVVMAFVCHSAWAFGLVRLRHVLALPAARVALEALTAGALFLLAGRLLSEAIWR